MTSSNFGYIYKRKDDTPPDSAIKTVLVYTDITSKAIEWGRKHEAAARRKYFLEMNKTHKNLNVSECGLLVSEKMPYFGASPHGLVECSCCGTGTIEIVRINFEVKT